MEKKILSYLPTITFATITKQFQIELKMYQEGRVFWGTEASYLQSALGAGGGGKVFVPFLHLFCKSEITLTLDT